MPVPPALTPTVALLDVHGLSKSFTRRGLRAAGRVVTQALLDVSFSLDAGEILGVVGESGSGKSTLARTLVGLMAADTGQAVLDGRYLFGPGRSPLAPQERGMQIVFQDPFASLNPRMTVGDIICEGLNIRGEPRRSREAKLATMLERIGFRTADASRYPHQFSGGQRQRISIARALVLAPRLLIADEPVSALDVSIQLQILNLLLELRRELGIAILFITHDIAVVDYLCDRVLVMYRGAVVENGAVDAVLDHPQHPYTARLIGAVPRIPVVNS